MILHSAKIYIAGPWDRLPLTIRWLKQEYQEEFDTQHLPPPHMAIAYGPVKTKPARNKGKLSTNKNEGGDKDENKQELPSLSTTIKCSVCYERLKVSTTPYTAFFSYCQ